MTRMARTDDSHVNSDKPSMPVKESFGSQRGSYPLKALKGFFQIFAGVVAHGHRTSSLIGIDEGALPSRISTASLAARSPWASP